MKALTLGGEIVELAEPMVDIKPGTLFSWSDSLPMLTVTPGPRNLLVYIHEGRFLTMDRPERWWHFWTWVRVCRALWRLPS